MLNIPRRRQHAEIGQPVRTHAGAIVMVITSGRDTLAHLREVVRLAARTGRHLVLALPMPTSWGFELMGPVPTHQTDDYEIDWFLAVAPLMVDVSWDIEPICGSAIKHSRVLATRYMADTVLLSTRQPLRRWWWARRLNRHVRVLSMGDWVRTELTGT